MVERGKFVTAHIYGFEIREILYSHERGEVSQTAIDGSNSLSLVFAYLTIAIGIEVLDTIGLEACIGEGNHVCGPRNHLNVIGSKVIVTVAYAQANICRALALEKFILKRFAADHYIKETILRSYRLDSEINCLWCGFSDGIHRLHRKGTLPHIDYLCRSRRRLHLEVELRSTCGYLSVLSIGHNSLSIRILRHECNGLHSRENIRNLLMYVL